MAYYDRIETAKTDLRRAIQDIGNPVMNEGDPGEVDDFQIDGQLAKLEVHLSYVEGQIQSDDRTMKELADAMKLAHEIRTSLTYLRLGVRNYVDEVLELVDVNTAARKARREARRAARSTSENQAEESNAEGPAVFAETEACDRLAHAAE